MQKKKKMHMYSLFLFCFMLQILTGHCFQVLAEKNPVPDDYVEKETENIQPLPTISGGQMSTHVLENRKAGG